MRSIRPLLLVCAATLAACTAGQLAPLAFLKPSVRLHHLSLKNVGLMGGTLDVVLALYNPNRVSVRGTKLQAGLDIESTHFGDISLSDPFQLTNHDTTLVTVPLTFRWSGMAAAARSLVNYGAVNYKMTGTASVETPLGQALEVPFSGEGSVPLLHPGSPGR